MEQVWKDAFDLIFGESQDPGKVIEAITKGLAEVGSDKATSHPAMQALTAYLAFLFGSPEGPSSASMMEVGMKATENIPDMLG